MAMDFLYQCSDWIILCSVVAWNFLKDRESEIVERHPIDWIGLFLLSLSVASLQIMLDKGKDLDWFESNIIIALTLVSAISFVILAYGPISKNIQLSIYLF